jgi:hypothetical protein
MLRSRRLCDAAIATVSLASAFAGPAAAQELAAASAAGQSDLPTSRV